MAVLCHVQPNLNNMGSILVNIQVEREALKVMYNIRKILQKHFLDVMGWRIYMIKGLYSETLVRFVDIFSLTR